MRNESARNLTKQSREKEIEERFFDLGKFVRKNPYPKEGSFPSDYISADRTKPSQNQTIAKEEVTPRVLVKKISDYFSPTERKLEKEK